MNAKGAYGVSLREAREWAGEVMMQHNYLFCCMKLAKNLLLMFPGSGKAAHRQCVVSEF